jgi:molecular chaperone DnaK
MPIVRKFIEEVMGKPPETGVDPMECVAMGAAIQAGVIAGEITDLLLLDVTPLSLGVETVGGLMTKIIERNTTIPTRKSQIFSTASDFQTAVTIHVLQGERPMAADNISLGMFNLVGIPPAPRGVPQIEVTFDIDANGILHVSAKDLATGNEQKITITASTKLTDEQIKKMIKEAEQYAEQDRIKKEEAELLNKADNLIYTTNKTVKDLGEKIPEADRRNLEKLSNELEKAVKERNMPVVKTKIDELTNLLQEASAKVYQQAAQQYAQQQTTQSANKKDEKVVDADYKVVDEKEKK